MKNSDIKRFTYIIANNKYIHNIEQSGYGLEEQTEGFYNEVKDDDKADSDIEETREQNDIDNEMLDALDVDYKEDYEELDYDDGNDYAN